MNVILFDHPSTKVNLLPFTFLRPVADIRIGILTIKEKWEKLFPASYSYLTAPYLNKKFASRSAEHNLYVNGAVLPNADLISDVKKLRDNEVLIKDNLPVAFYGSLDSDHELNLASLKQDRNAKEIETEITTLNYVFDIFINNEKAVKADYELITAGRKSKKIDDSHSIVYNPENVFIEENASIKAAILDASNGPIYIGTSVTINPGSIVRGSTAICEGANLNLGTKIRGDSTIGPFCKVGGEISNTVMFGYSSKSHDGYLGNSVIAEWCNIGAGTSASNLKNNYGEVRIWNYAEEGFKSTGKQFCGLMMGDHSKCGINTMFNTGTVVGISANIFGSGFPRSYIPSFSWGGAQGFSEYRFDKATEVIEKVYARRRRALESDEMDILKHIFELTHNIRQKER